MNHKTEILFLLVLAVLVIAGCAPRVALAPTPTRQAGQVSNLEELVNGLKSSGATVELSDEQDSFFPVTGRMISVDNASLSAWEFQNEAARETAAATISGGGFIIGSTAVDWIDQPHFFAQGRLIVLYVGRDGAMIDLLSNLLGEPINGQTSGDMATIDKAPFALAAKAFLAQQLGISEEDVIYQSAEAVEWSDSCLGLGGPAESCLLAVTPGYRVTLGAGGQSYTLRTDEIGEQVRLEQ